MAETPSTMIALGTTAPEFTPDTRTDEMVSLKEMAGADGLHHVYLQPLPYVVHAIDEITRITQDYKGISFCAINSNNPETHPQDGPEFMKPCRRAWVDFPTSLTKVNKSLWHTKQRALLTSSSSTKIWRCISRAAGQRETWKCRPCGWRTSGRRWMHYFLWRNLRDQRPSCGCNIKWKPENRPSY